MADNNKIIEAILQKANEEANEIKNKTSLDCSLKMEKAKKDAEILKEEKINIAKKDAEAIIENSKTITRLDVNKIMLGGKRQIIDSVYQSIVDKLMNLDKDSYTKLVCKIISSNYSNGEKVIVSSNANVDKEKIKDCKFIKENFINISFDGDFSSGLKLVGNGFEKVFTFECLVEDLRSTTEMEVNKLLF